MMGGRMPRPPLDSSWARGQRVGRYEILTRLSVGGMAEVFLAVVGGPGGFRKFVTLKRILPSLQEDEEFVRMFLDEARITAALSHSNIAQLFDLGEESGELFLAMEFIPGQDLGRVFRGITRPGGELPIGFSCAVVRDLCVALHYAHHFTDAGGRLSPVIHRDISPKNVMVTYGGDVKVIDFGIAKARGKLEETDAGLVKGSTSYMSPEQILGERLDGRSDLFSAGVVLWELLAGRRLYKAREGPTVMRQVLKDPILPPQAVNPKVSSALSDVVVRALAKDPQERFATGREMARMIESAAGVPIFDEDQLGAFMRENFRENLEKTQALLASVQAGDADRLRLAAHELAQDAGTHSTSAAPKPDEVPTKAMNQAEPEPSASKIPGGAVILAVDDSKTGLLVLQTYLSREGYRVVGCAAPSEAFATLERLTPELIILDVLMPEMDGFELCRRIREQERLRLVPIIFLSAACSLDERVKGLTVGGDDFIRKPYEPEEFTARIRAHLHRSALSKRTEAVATKGP
jgi:serine/threonine protein kinase/ActR/RegA family two-component response regulator